MDLELVNIISTSFLSLLLIISTIIISVKQYNLQKRLSEEQNKQQEIIANNNYKVSLYQNRINCYLHIMQALDILYKYNIGTILDVYISNDFRPVLNHFSKINELTYKSYVESKALFSDNVFQYIKNIYEKTNRINDLFINIFTMPSDLKKQKREHAIQKITSLLQSMLINGIHLNEPFNDFHSKAKILLSTPESISILREFIPESIEIENILIELKTLYQPNNELFNMIKHYVTFDNNTSQE